VKITIRQKLIFINLFIMVPLLFVSSYSYFLMIQTTRQESSWKIRVIADEIAKDLGDHFINTFNVIDAIANHPSVINMNPSENDRLFARLLPSYPLHLNILAANMDGFNVGSAVSSPDVHQLNYLDKAWFLRSISGQKIVGNLHLSKLFKAPAIMVSGPVYGYDGSIKGVVGLPLNLDNLRQKLIMDWQLPFQSIILVADGEGNILVDTMHKEHIGQNLAHTKLLIAAKTNLNNFIEMPASDGIMRLYYVTSPAGTDWRIVVGVPSISLIHEAVRINGRYLIAILVAIILGVFVSRLISRRITENVKLIVAGTKAIANNQLDHRLNLRGCDELAEIGGYFNKMAEEHQKYEQEIKGINSLLEERVEARTAELLTANKELDAFSYSVSHDLRAPLRGIRGFSSILLEDYGNRLDADGKQHIERICHACDRMNSLIDDLIQFSQVSRAELNKKTVNLSEIARNIADELQNQEPERPVDFQISPDIYAEADPLLIRTVIENLLGNSWKYTRYTGQPVIKFGVKDVENCKTYFVQDNGAGFNQAYVDKLFNVFQRLHTSDKFEGSGIGLASVNRIVKRHGGRIWAEGKEGEGAIFSFTL
jgi:signal transduction histidine kinase